MTGELPHLNPEGEVHMVDVGGKDVTVRRATAEARVRMSPGLTERLFAGELPKGDALATVRIAGIMAAKKTHELIPLCHPLMLTAITVDFTPDEERGAVVIEARVETRGQTGVEMEALTAVSVAALTIYDMVKAVDRGMVIDQIRLEEKRGGRSGTWRREG